MYRLAACFFATVFAASAVNLVISNTSAPAGSATQIQFSLASPANIAVGELTVDLDPAVFQSVNSSSVFSGAGDAAGYVVVNGLHVDVNFHSSGGIVGNPTVVLTAAIRPDAAYGARTAITADPGGTTWRDSTYQPLPVTITPGSFTVGGVLSVSNVQPGSGILLAGAVIRVDGTGFSAATTVEIQAAVLGSTVFVSPTQINVTLAGPTEISGKRVRVRNPDGPRVDFFPSYWSGEVLSTSPTDPFYNAFPILPLQAYRQSVTGSFRVFSGWLVVQNPNSDPVDVTLQVLQDNYTPSGQSTFRLPPGGISYQNLSTIGVPLENSVRVLASSPVRVLELSAYTNYFGSAPPVSQRTISGVSPIDLGPLRVSADYGQDSVSWIWQTGTARPAAKSFVVSAPDRDQNAAFTVTTATSTGGKWLSATPSTAKTCAIRGSGCTDPSVTASIDPTGLAPGIYRGSITLTPVPTTVRPDVVPTVVAVTLTVSMASVVNTVNAWGATFVKPGPPGLPNSQPFNIFSDVFPGPFSIAVHTDSGGNWLSATSSGTAPAVLTLSGDLGTLAPGRYSGEVVLTGGGNTLVIPASAFVYGGVQLNADSPLRFSARAGDPAPPSQTATVVPQCAYCPDPTVPPAIPFAALVSTNSGGNWLSALPSAGSVSVSVNPAGLAPGVYTGAITLISSATTGNTQIPVALAVWSGTVPGLTASPSSLFTTWPQGGAGYPCVSTGSAAVTVSARASTSDGGDWLKIGLTAPVTPTCGISTSVDGSKLAPGTYTGSITVTAADQSISIPVTFVVPAPPPPMLSSIVNAASMIEGPIALGEIVTIRGVGLGSSQVLFDGTSAQVLYASDSQINAIVPGAVSGKAAVTIQVRLNGQSASWTVPVAPAAPGIFTLDSSGAGAAAVLNQDNSVNGPGNPAARGSVIQIFATGGAPLSVSIGGADAAIQYAGPAPGAVAGLFQVNAVVPTGITPGASIPVVLSIGPWTSQSGATIAVR